MDRKKANKIYQILSSNNPEASTSLVYSDPYQLLIATILSAQCTDSRVNMVTQRLFQKYASAEELAGADIDVLHEYIKPTGFFRSKSANIKEACRMIVENHGGNVPRTMDTLISLPGVARKTANIVLYHGFGIIEGIAVDTHVKRVSFRIGFTDFSDPVKVERDLMSLFEKKIWGKFSNVLIDHGRAICGARKPKCRECPIIKLCAGKGVFGK